MALYDLTEFFRLSAALNYQLSASSVGREGILATILGGNALPASEEALLLDVIEYLEDAYAEKHRRLGPWAVLHPLRAAALLVRAQDDVSLLDLLTELLHDKFEDIGPDEFEPAEWADLERRFLALLQRIDQTREWYLMERLDALTRRSGRETYYQYVGRLLDRAASTPELVRAKLADRLDNTLDMRTDFRDPLEGVDFFAKLVETLFVRDRPVFATSAPHPPRPPLDGARRLYELFKNTVLLSLVRQKVGPVDDEAAAALFEAIAVASMREAQRVVMHIFAYHFPDVAAQRRLVLETMDYCLSGGIDAVTRVNERNRLDGLFLERFDAPSSAARQAKLERLYEDKELMIAAGLAFIVIFINFQKDRSFLVHGVSPEGIYAG